MTDPTRPYRPCPHCGWAGVHHAANCSRPARDELIEALADRDLDLPTLADDPVAQRLGIDPGDQPSVETSCTHDGSVHRWREGCPR